MARFRLDILASLARQLAFAPALVRDRQIAAAEELAITIDPAKAYPPDYVLFRITGHNLKQPKTDLLTGLALQHDLGLLIEQVSETLKQKTVDREEPVLTIDDLTEKFNVTSKTIQRWRRKGLSSRKFIFPDGKSRVGFRLAVVEQFLAAHKDAVTRGSNFSQVADVERDLILAKARRLATQCNCCVNEISRRIARKLNRSPLTIQATIRKHDAENPEQAIFATAAIPLDDASRVRAIRIVRKSGSVARASRKLECTRGAVYRAVMDERLAKLMDRRVKFIDDTLYHQDDAEQLLNELAREEGVRSANELPESNRIPSDLPTYLRELYRTPLLTPSRERGLFLKFNFHKYQFSHARRRLDPAKARNRDLDRLNALLKKAVETKNEIIRANLRLVVSVAKKHVRAGVTLMELVSEGNITLMRAAESFDVHKGNKFSTYATFALMKGYARSVPQMIASGRKAITSDSLGELADRNRNDQHDVIVRDQVQRLMSNLDDRERRVIGAQFGIDAGRLFDADELAGELGVTRNRLKQIERTALDKLRAAAGQG